MEARMMRELDAIFNPHSVAVIGAREVDGFSTSLSGTKLKENLFLVNPKHHELLGRKCYPSILDIKEDIDYVIIEVPAVVIPRVLEDCIKKKVKAAHIFSSGFSETGLAERVNLEDEVKKLAKGKIRLIGPNCMGIHHAKSGLAFSPGAPAEEGSIGVISQSGTFADAFLDLGRIRNINFSKVVSYGNGIDLDCPDFLEYLAQDGETTAIALYIEGTRDGARLKSALRKAAKRKPVIALKGGVTGHGSRAAASHTGSLAGSPQVWRAFFKQAGVVQVETFDELTNTILAVSHSPLPSGKGVSLITNSGGFSVMETDMCVKAGLEVPQFTKKTLRELRKIVPLAGTGINNPLDAWPLYYNPTVLRDTIKAIARDGNIHSLVLHIDEMKYWVQVLGEATEDTLKEILPLMVEGCVYTRDEINKPVMVCVALEAYSQDEKDRKYHLMVKREFESRGFPVYPTLEGTIKTLFNLYRYRRRASPR